MHEVGQECLSQSAKDKSPSVNHLEGGMDCRGRAGTVGALPRLCTHGNSQSSPTATTEPVPQGLAVASI